MFDLSNQVTVVTGGGGALCARMCSSLASVGCSVGVLDTNQKNAKNIADLINQSGGRAISCQCDVLDKDSIHKSLEKMLNVFGKVDILVNGAGGNRPEATTSADNPFFDIPIESINKVFNINFTGTLLCCQVYGKYFSEVRNNIFAN
jgi:NAD(P)-dependent dehydrogenase (short-subunit alcohol dehydrogenase family)